MNKEKHHKDMDNSSYILPVDRLNYSINEFFGWIKTIDIENAVKKGLNPKITICEQVKGKTINACCAPDGNVYISRLFAQSIWNLCYVALKLSDYKITEEGFAKENHSYNEMYEEMKSHRNEYEEVDYLMSLYEAENWEDMLWLTIACSQKNLIEKDYIKLSNLPVDNSFCCRVNGIYHTAVGSILLHELIHFDNNHFIRKIVEKRKDLEMEADNLAFDAVIQISDHKRQETAVIGVMCAHLISFFSNPQLKPLENYYREDVRLFHQYDKIKDNRRKASIIIANVLSKWFEHSHSVIIDQLSSEEETVNLIRSEIINHFGPTDNYTL